MGTKMSKSLIHPCFYDKSGPYYWGVVRPILISNAKRERDDVVHPPNSRRELQRQCVMNICAFHQPSCRWPRSCEVDVVTTWVGMVVRPFEVGGSFFVIWDRLWKSKTAQTSWWWGWGAAILMALVLGIGVEAVVLGVPGWWCRRGPDCSWLQSCWPTWSMAWTWVGWALWGLRWCDMSAAASARVGVVLQEWWWEEGVGHLVDLHGWWPHPHISTRGEEREAASLHHLAVSAVAINHLRPIGRTGWCW